MIVIESYRYPYRILTVDTDKVNWRGDGSSFHTSIFNDTNQRLECFFRNVKRYELTNSIPPLRERHKIAKSMSSLSS